jgi:hypothetical protein
MSTLDDVLTIQKSSNYLQAPTANTNAEYDKAVVASTEVATTTASTLTVALVNNTSSSNVYAYITGLAINKNSAVCLLQSDGETVYYPDSPASDGTALSANCSIALGAPGATKTVTIPQIAGGRIWFCVGAELTFLLNPGPGLVEPSVTNTADPNYNLHWDFCEFTFNTTELFANITYVDFVSLPIALSLSSTSGATQTVEGLPANGLTTVCQDLTSQQASDNAGWGSLIVKDTSGNYLRALSPNSAIVMNSSLFSGYYSSYVNQVWSKYASTGLSVDTQAQWGVLTGQVSDNELTFQGVGAFAQPSAADIFSCSTGPFAAYATNTAEMGNLTARLAAAFNRSTLLINEDQPDSEVISTYYTNSITNHYGTQPETISHLTSRHSDY